MFVVLISLHYYITWWKFNIKLHSERVSSVQFMFVVPSISWWCGNNSHVSNFRNLHIFPCHRHRRRALLEHFNQTAKINKMIIMSWMEWSRVEWNKRYVMGCVAAIVIGITYWESGYKNNTFLSVLFIRLASPQPFKQSSINRYAWTYAHSCVTDIFLGRFRNSIT